LETVFEISSKNFLKVELPLSSKNIFIYKLNAGAQAVSLKTLLSNGFIAFKNWIIPTTSSFSFHIALFLLTFLFSKINFTGLSLTDKNQNEVQIEEAGGMQVAVQSFELEDIDKEYSGVSPNFFEVASKEVIQQKVENTAKKISNIAAQLAKINIGKNVQAQNAGSLDAGKLSGIAKAMGAFGVNGIGNGIVNSNSFGKTSSDAKWKISSGSGKTLSDSDRQKLASLFAKIGRDLDQCYEIGLENDPELSVVAPYRGVISDAGVLSNPSVDLKGQGNNESKSALKKCMEKKLAGHSVGNSLAGVTVVYEFIFRR